MKLYDTCWCLMKFDEGWWHLMMLADILYTWWCLIIPSDTFWHLIYDPYKPVSWTNKGTNKWTDNTNPKVALWLKTLKVIDNTRKVKNWVTRSWATKKATIYFFLFIKFSTLGTVGGVGSVLLTLSVIMLWEKFKMLWLSFNSPDTWSFNFLQMIIF